ncbi:MAG TPA: hypothetical protein VGC10_08575, partial [Sphingomonas sp.]
SWNRDPPSGYRVAFVPFAGTRPSGAKPRDVLTGFLTPDGKATHGRPVGVAIDKTGGLLVADDGGNVVWRVTAAAPVVRNAGLSTPLTSGSAPVQPRHARRI